MYYHFTNKLNKSYASCVFTNNAVMTFSTQFMDKFTFDLCAATGVQLILAQYHHSGPVRIDTIKAVYGRYVIMLTIPPEDSMTRETKVEMFNEMSAMFLVRLRHVFGYDNVIQIQNLKEVPAYLLTVEEMLQELPQKHHFTERSLKAVPYSKMVQIMSNYRLKKRLTTTEISKLNDYVRYQQRRARERVRRRERIYKTDGGTTCQICKETNANLIGDIYWGCFQCKLAYHKSCFEKEIYDKGICVSCSCSNAKRALINSNVGRTRHLKSAEDVCSVCLGGEVDVDPTKYMLQTRTLYSGCKGCKMLIHNSCYNELLSHNENGTCINCRITSDVGLSIV